MCGCEPTGALLDKLKEIEDHRGEGRNSYGHSFVTCAGTYSGTIVAIEPEFLVLRVDQGYRAWQDIHIRLCCLCVISEHYSAE